MSLSRCQLPYIDKELMANTPEAFSWSSSEVLETYERKCVCGMKFLGDATGVQASNKVLQLKVESGSYPQSLNSMVQLSIA